MTEHTPGPWTTKHDASEMEHRVSGAGWDSLAVAFGNEDPTRAKQGAANALLIAAAPDLLDALKALEPYLDHIPGGIGGEIDDARAAIAKAEGK